MRCAITGLRSRALYGPAMPTREIFNLLGEMREPLDLQPLHSGLTKKSSTDFLWPSPEAGLAWTWGGKSENLERRPQLYRLPCRGQCGALKYPAPACSSRDRA